MTYLGLWENLVTEPQVQVRALGIHLPRASRRGAHCHRAKARE